MLLYAVETENFFETVAGQLKPTGSKLAISGDKILILDAVTRAKTAHQDADKRCVVTIQDEAIDEMEAGLADSDYFDVEPAPLSPKTSTNNVQVHGMDEATLSTFAKLNGSPSTTRHNTQSCTSIRAHTHTSAETT